MSTHNSTIKDHKALYAANCGQDCGLFPLNLDFWTEKRSVKNECLIAKVCKAIVEIGLIHTNQFNLTINLSNSYEMPIKIKKF